MMRFEWKKIFERRLNVIAMIAGYVLLGLCLFSYIRYGNYYYDEATGTYVDGIQGIRLSQQRTTGQTDVVSEEYMTQLIREIQSYGLDQESDEAYVKIARPMGDIYYFAARNYTDMRTKDIDRNALNEVDLTVGAGFYEQRMKKITDYLNCDFSYGNYKESEKAFWIQKAEAVEVPFRWGDKNVMNITWDIISLGFYFLFVIVICVSSVFSGEYETDAASLLLTTKHGKGRLVWSKIAVSVLFTVGYLTVGSGIAVAVIGLIFGFPGADLPVQLWDSVIPYNLTIGETCLLSFMLIVFIALTVTLVMLCCSAGLHSSFATLVIGMVILVAPAFFPMSKTSGLWNHINYLFPVRVMNFKDLISSYVSYTAGKYVISYAAMTVIVYTVIGVAALLSTRRGFVKME